MKAQADSGSVRQTEGGDVGLPGADVGFAGDEVDAAGAMVGSA